MDDIWGHFQETGFNKYFSDESTTITKLLLDENIITELKNENPQLLQQQRLVNVSLQQHKKEFITVMIEDTVVMPTQSDGYDRGHRLPYISSELLALDSDLIYKEFFKEGENVVDNEYWVKLLSFLDNQSASNEVLMGYFEKVISNLYLGNKVNTANVIAANLTKFTKMLPNGSVGDIIKKSLVLYNEADGAALQERKKILQETMGLLVQAGEDVRVICADIVGEVVNKFQAFSSGEALVETLFASQSFHQLYDIQNSEAVNEFLIALVKKSQQRVINQNDESVPILYLPQAHKEGLRRYLARQVDQIRQRSMSSGFIVNQDRQTVRKSNRAMYSILNLIGLVLKDNYSGFVNEGLVSFLWHLVLLYPYNNILHVLVRKIFLGILDCDDIAAKKCFLMNYQASIVNLGKQHLTLLRPFLYSIWFEARKYPKVTTDAAVLGCFDDFVKEHLEPLTQYEIKPVQKTSMTSQKLIVDEGDLAKAPREEGEHMVQEEVAEPAGQTVSEEREEDYKEDKIHDGKKNPETVMEEADFFNIGGNSQNKAEPGEKQEAFNDFFASSPLAPRQEVSFKKPDTAFDLFGNFADSPSKGEEESSAKPLSSFGREEAEGKQPIKESTFDEFMTF